MINVEEKVSQEQEGEVEAAKETVPADGSVQRRAVSLPWEVAILQDSIGAARVLTDLLREGTLPDQEEERIAFNGLSAVLSLVWCRLRDLGRVTGGYLDPVVLLAPHNEALEGEGKGQLVPWTLRRRKRWLKSELEKVRAEIEASKAGHRDGPRTDP